MRITYGQLPNLSYKVSLIPVYTCKTYEGKLWHCVLKNKQMSTLEYNKLYLDRDHFGVPKTRVMGGIMPTPTPLLRYLKSVKIQIGG